MTRNITIYTEEMQTFISKNQYGITRKELTKMFNKKFSTNVSVDSIKQCCLRRGLRNGSDGRFKKYQKPWNDGLKVSPELYRKMKPTMFKKGLVPARHREVGEERITKDGYIEVKVAEPRSWELKHRIVWQKEHGQLAKGYAVIFRDGNKLNTNIDNLRMVSNQELLIMNRSKLRSNIQEITDVGINIAKLINVTNKAKRNKEGK